MTYFSTPILTVPLLVALLAISLAGHVLVFGQELKIGAEFVRQENEFLYDDAIYNMTSSNVTLNDNRMCPSNACTFIFEEGTLSPDFITGEYSVDGKLNAYANETSEPVTYDVRIDLEVGEMLDEGNRTININTGTVGIGGNALFNPLYEYRITNGTLNFGNITLVDLYAVKP